MVASPLSLPPSLLTYLLPYQLFFVPGIGLVLRLCAWISPPQIDTLGESGKQRRTRSVTMELTPRSLYKPPVEVRGLAEPGGAEILYEWVLRTIGTADSDKEIRRRIFNGANTPALGDAVPSARQYLAANNHGVVAALIPDYDRGTTKGPWKTFKAAAGFDEIKRELQQAAGVPQVFSPHELLNRPRGLMRSALPDRCGRSRNSTLCLSRGMPSMPAPPPPPPSPSPRFPNRLSPHTPPLPLPPRPPRCWGPGVAWKTTGGRWPRTSGRE